MKAAIVTIGDEILIGQIVDTNSGYIAKALDKIGVEVKEMVSIGDDENQILSLFSSLQNQVDLVVITGGLGPTKDDITKKTFCKYFDDEFVENKKVLDHVVNLVENYFKRPASKMNKDQALVPSKAEVLFNAVGTAPGMWMEKEKTVFVSLPGVPFEMRYLVDEVLIPKVVDKFERSYILHQNILTYGQGESLVAERLEAWEENLPNEVKMAYLPSLGSLKLRLTARGDDQEKLKQILSRLVLELQGLIGDIIVGLEENESIEVVIGNLLKQQQATIATAESCTIGQIGQKIASVAGASAYYKGTVVSYATEVKQEVLGISNELLDTYSVVSKEVALEMAKSVREMMKTTYAIATTGHAGPTKGEGKAEVGTVFVAIVGPKTSEIHEFNFGKPREKVIERAVTKSLELIRKEILKNIV